MMRHGRGVRRRRRRAVVRGLEPQPQLVRGDVGPRAQRPWKAVVVADREATQERGLRLLEPTERAVRAEGEKRERGERRPARPARLDEAEGLLERAGREECFSEREREARPLGPVHVTAFERAVRERRG